MGGQLMMVPDLVNLRMDICNGRLDSWKDIHQRYDEIWERYPADKLRHAFQVMCLVMGIEHMTPDAWLVVLAEEERVQRRIAEQVYLSRKKDYDNPFRRATCRSEEEVEAVFGSLEDNSFIKQMRQEMYRNIERIEILRNRIQ